MPQSSSAPEAGPRPTAWVFAAPGAGDNRQLETLVELIDADAQWIEPVDPVGTVLADRALDAGGKRVPAGKRERFVPPWPDLVLIAGGRSVIDAKRIRRASGGTSRIVCIGRPWAPLDWFDLVVTTPQYRLPDAPNVLTLDLPLNVPPKPCESDLQQWREALAELPRPWLGVLLGGDSGSYRFTRGNAAALGEALNRLLERTGGSAVVAGSPRTPGEATDELEHVLTVPARVFPFGDGPNPYAALLALADALIVTADSASMLAEACFSGKPVALADLHERPRARLTRRLRTRLPALERATQALTVRGLWVPARDMTELHRRAAGSGRLTDPERLLTRAAEPRAPQTPSQEVRARVHALLSR